MKGEEGFYIVLKQLKVAEIEDFFVSVDNELFEKLTDRLNVREYSKKLYEHALHFSAYKGEELVGLSPCYFNNDSGGIVYISALVVKNVYRGNGLKQKLFDSIKKHAKAQNFTEMVVSFHCENQVSVNFYESNLFEKHTQNGGLCVFKLNPL